MENKITLRDYNSLVDLSRANLTPRQAILFKCRECCGFEWGEARACDSKTCALWQISRRYMNKQARTIKPMTEEQKEAMIQRLTRMRERKLSNED